MPMLTMNKSQWLCLLFMMLPVMVAANVNEAWDKLVWDFADFAYHFETKNWQGVYPYIHTETKVGFGGEMGVEGVKQIYGDGGKCFADMVFALKQGCRKSQGGTELSCVSPPQWSDPAVVYLGARARFSWRKQDKKWVADFLICGGD